MPLLVVGSVAFDSVETPQETRENVLGGSAVFFSYAASFFTPVRLVGVVGQDWPAEHTELLQSRNIDTAGLRVMEGKQTFRWRGRYLPNMNDRETLDVQLNVFGEFDPILPDSYKNCPYVFLANGVPAVQLKVLDQVNSPRLVMADTMDLWINEHRDTLMTVLDRVNGLLLNDSEAMLLTDETNLVRAGRRILEMGPEFVIIKKGEHGAMCVSREETAVFPAFPIGAVTDPTGAGDCFAGGMMGYIAEQGQFNARVLKNALAYGTLVASFNVEDFSLDQLRKIERADLDRRFAEYKAMLSL